MEARKGRILILDDKPVVGRVMAGVFPKPVRLSALQQFLFERQVVGA